MKLHSLAIAVMCLGFGACDDSGGSGSDSDTTASGPGTSGGIDPGSSSASETTGASSSGSESSSGPGESSGTESSGAHDDSTGSSGGATGRTTPWSWSLPTGFPMPYVPEDNPMTVEGVELGRHLFYDTRLSVDGTYSCATCHEQASAFTDGLARAEGVLGDLHPRSSMSLTNVAYAATLAWGNPELVDLETHALGPMFGTEPVELGLVDEADMLSRLADEPRYTELFAAAYPDDTDPMSLEHVAQAIASFQRSLISGDAPFDRWFFDGDEDAVDDAVKRGWDVFNFPGECTYCHFNFNFSDSTYFESLTSRPQNFHNTALYNEDGQGAYPPGNEGLYNFTGEPSDMGRFKSPTLRNATVTAPYMHDGSIATLEEVIEHYELGGRVDSPHADFQMKSFSLEDGERADLLAFLASLTDETFLTNPDHGNPWVESD